MEARSFGGVLAVGLLCAMASVQGASRENYDDGVLVIECANPAQLFWLDPVVAEPVLRTHVTRGGAETAE